MKKRRPFIREFKLEAVRLLEEGKPGNILGGSGIGANGNIACEAISSDSAEYCLCRSNGRKDSPGGELPTAVLSY